MKIRLLIFPLLLIGGNLPRPAAALPTRSDTYDRVVGTVISVKEVVRRVGRGEEKKFLEVRLNVKTSDTYSAKMDQKLRPTPSGQSLALVYVRPAEKIKVGDVFVGMTHPSDRPSADRTPNNFLATYQVRSKP